jgi:hypothetical protein
VIVSELQALSSRRFHLDFIAVQPAPPHPGLEAPRLRRPPSSSLHMREFQTRWSCTGSPRPGNSARQRQAGGIYLKKRGLNTWHMTTHMTKPPLDILRGSFPICARPYAKAKQLQNARRDLEYAPKEGHAVGFQVARHSRPAAGAYTPPLFS